MPVTTASPAPYAPPGTVLDFLKRYRERGLQAPFTKEVLERAGVAQTLIARTLAALQSLDLVDDSQNPTAALDALAVAPQAEYKDRLAAVVRDAYSDIFKFTDPAEDDVSKVRDAFRPYNPRGQQSRMVTLFLGLCQEAGIIEKVPTRPGPKPGTAQVSKNRPRKVQPEHKPRRRKDGAALSSVGELPEALQGLLATLPEKWTQERRDKFMSAFAVVLDYSIPILAAEEEDDEEEVSR